MLFAGLPLPSVTDWRVAGAAGALFAGLPLPPMSDWRVAGAAGAVAGSLAGAPHTGQTGQLSAGLLRAGVSTTERRRSRCLRPDGRLSPVQSGLLPGSDAQLGLRLVMLVNVGPHLLLLLDDAGPGVAEEGAPHSRHPAQLHTCQEADRSP